MPPNSALAARKTALLDRLRNTTGARLAATFRQLDDYANEERWATLAGPVVSAAQQRAAATQIAYLQSVLDVRLDADMAPILERAAVDLHEPFIAFANAIDGGSEFTDAVTSGALRAEGVGESSVTYAARSASSTADRHVKAWTRVLSADPCEWCQLVAQQTYRTAEAASFGHLRCNCDVDVA